MRHLWRLTGASALALLVFAMPAAAVPDQGKKANDDTANGKSTKHDFKSPMAEKQDALLQRALEAKLAGKANGKVHEVAKGQFVQLEREGTDRVFAIIAEFGNTRHTSFCDPGQACAFPPDGSAQRYDGPLHNEIPEPDRAIDNSTLWQADYSTAHYEDMYFNRMAEYFEHQSSNRYSVAGDVHGWVKVPFNEARYGRDFCGGIVCNNTWFLIRDAMAYWVQGQRDLGKTNAEIEAYLTTFDVQDRYDFDGDGNFAEKDGYIDHFQIVHAGGDQAAGDPYQGSDAIWSHRWYSNLHPGGPTGGAQFNGTQIGRGGVSSGVTVPSNPLNVWIGDYTIQPENGGLGVFAHEYAHDLGLPDLYDTSGNTGGAENNTGFWSLMSSGANIGDGGPDGIGDAPTDLTAWELFQLGWLSPQGGKGPFYDVAFAGQKSEHKLGPNDAATKKAQALFVVLPEKQVPLDLGAPAEGSAYYYSSSGDEIDNVMYRQVTLPAGSTLTAKARYEIELDWDYAYVVVSTDGGATWQGVPTNLSSATDPHGQNFGNGITGTSNDAWVDLTADLSGFSGSVLLGFRYWTDVAVVEPGFQADAVKLNGAALGDSETAAGWTFDPAEGGFRVTTGSEQQSFFNAYVAENRQYDNYDASLKTAYNFGFLNTLAGQDKVEHFRYQDGLLINYWDGSFGDNNVGDHPGGGLILPVDAHPTFAHHPDGHLIRPRIMSFDSTFGLESTDAITINKNSQPVTIASQPAVPVFDDRKDYWFNTDGHATTGSHVGRYQPGWFGVNVPKTGTQIRVKSVSAQGNFMQVEVSPAK